MTKGPVSGEIDRIVDMALAAVDNGQDRSVLPIVDTTLERHPGEARLWQMKGLLHRVGEDMQSAISALRRAAALSPDDPKIGHALAQSIADAGHPAVDAFEAALRSSAAPRDILPGLTAARLAEQGPAAAIGPLAHAVARDPDWLQGHWLLARIRWLAGERDTFATSLMQAIRARPYNIPLWAQLIYVMVHARLFDTALAIISSARRATGGHPVFDVNEAICLSETGQLDAADRAFAQQGDPRDIATAIQRVRHELRSGRPEQAARFAEPYATRHHAPLMIPYLSVIWRLTGDARWIWLEGDESLIGVQDLQLEAGFLDALATRLRGLHTLSGEPIEQSIRIGSQTDGALLSRIEPEFRALRNTFAIAVAHYIARLPVREAAHPTLAPRRDAPIRFEGSWSVRLSEGGFHTNHVHPAGWLSSAFYIALPPPPQPGGSTTAGWLTLGQPPEELGLKLPPIRRVEPKAGRLVIFPSTMWHGTEPFAAGERLTVAFDVALPVNASSM
jgi:Flp pilus assembly protein TadD